MFQKTARPPRADSDGHSPVGAGRRSPWWLVAVLGTGVFVGGFDQTFVVTVLPEMQRDLGVSVDRFGQLSWVISGYLLGYTVAMPLMGRVADVYGHARMFVVALLLFMGGSLAVALAPNLWSLVAARAVSAVGGGAMVPISMALAAEVLPRSRRPLAIGGISALDDTSSLLGPLWGALVARLLDWRALFWLNIILAIPVLIAVLRLAPRDRPAHGGIVDWWGGGLLAAALTALTVALTDDGANPRPVSVTLLLMALALLLLAAFAWWEMRARVPLIDLGMFRSGRLTAANIAFFLEGGALITAMVNVPLMTQVLFGGDEVDGGLNFMRMVLFMPVGGVLGGLLAVRIGFRLTAVLGFLAAAAGLALMIAWPLDPGQLQLWLAMAIAGLGFTIADAPLYATVVEGVAPERRASAAALLQVLQTTGMIVGMALLASRGLATFNRRAADLFRERGLEGTEEAYRQIMHRTFDETFALAAVAMLIAAALALALAPGRARRFHWGRTPEEVPDGLDHDQR